LQDGKLEVLQDVSLDVATGEFVCIVGASGCGKSTLLRLIAGLDTEYSGSVIYEGQPVTGPDLSRGIVFQEHRLFPWLTVEQNIELAFGATPIGRHERRERVQEQILQLLRRLVHENGMSLGESGSGKSTLVRRILALEPPQRGEVLIRGHAFPSRSHSWTRRRACLSVFNESARR
jgi:ABC-type nitrate/sulfonate/bicarbonate transport system ATPase subunit